MWVGVYVGGGGGHLNNTLLQLYMQAELLR